MATSVGEFVLNLVVDASTGELAVNDLVASMGALNVVSVGEVAILQELAGRLSSLTDHAIKSAMGLTGMAEATGMSVEKLQGWRNVAAHTNVSAEDLDKTLTLISHALESGQRTGNFLGLRDLNHLLKLTGHSLLEFKANEPEKLLMAFKENKVFQDLPATTKKLWLASLSPVQEILDNTFVSMTKFREWFQEGPMLSVQDVQNFKLLNDDFVSIKSSSEVIKDNIAKWFSGDVGILLRGLVKLFRATADLSDEAKPHSSTALFGRKLAADILYPPALIRDLHQSGVSFGTSAGQLLEWMGAAIRRPFENTTVTQAREFANLDTRRADPPINVTINGTNLPPRVLMDVVSGAIKDARNKETTKVNSHVNRGTY